MLKIYCDFNDRTEDDLYWLLFHDGRPLNDVVGELDLRDGSRVVLFQDSDDFEVEATLLFERTDPGFFLGSRVCAKPEWATRLDLQP
jgi:hypothetical protein